MKKKRNFLLGIIYISVVLATWFGYETYLNSGSKKNDIRTQNTAEVGGYDSILGYRPFPNNEYVRTKTHKDEIIYQVNIKTDEHGLRISPPYDSDSLIGHCIFFGGSRTFGEGVENEATLPYQVGMMSEGAYRTYNFGYGGYGPHQMLAALESDMVEKIVPQDSLPKYVFYQAIKDHVKRVNGMVTWDPNGPRYLLDANGMVKHVGKFKEIRTVADQLKSFLRKSTTYRQIFEGYDDIGRDELALFAAVVEASKAKCELLFPGSEFYVLFWNGGKQLHKRMISVLNNRGIKVLLIYDILPEKKARAYRLHKYDSHPKPLAYELIAKYLVDNVLP